MRTRSALSTGVAGVLLACFLLVASGPVHADQSPPLCHVNNLAVDLGFPPADSNVLCGTIVPFTSSASNGSDPAACDVTNTTVTFTCPDPATGTATGPMTTLDTGATFPGSPPNSKTYPAQSCTIGATTGGVCSCAASGNYKATVEASGDLHDNPNALDSVDISKSVSIRCFTTTTTTTTSTSTTTTSTSTTTTTSTTSTTSTTVTTSTSTTTSTTSTTSTTKTTSTTTTSTSSTTTTTSPGCSRTPGFFGNHPSITANILASAGGFTICGKMITNINIDDAHSALEAICVSPQGNQRLQLARQLLVAALNGAGGCATFSELASCNAVCADPNSSDSAVSACEGDADSFNNSGDNIPAPFDTGGGANPGPCKAARGNACTILVPTSCAVHSPIKSTSSAQTRRLRRIRRHPAVGGGN